MPMALAAAWRPPLPRLAHAPAASPIRSATRVRSHLPLPLLCGKGHVFEARQLCKREKLCTATDGVPNENTKSTTFSGNRQLVDINHVENPTW